MTFRFLDPARIELLEARDYYEIQSPGLGADFVQEIESAIQQITRHPEAWGRLTSKIRRHLVHRFPYGVIYSHSNQGIIIISIFHLKRHPKSWRKNLL